MTIHDSQPRAFSPTATPLAADCCHSGARRGCRSNNPKWVFVEHSRSCRRAYRGDYDAPGPTSSRHWAWRADADAQEEMAAAARPLPSSSSAPPSWRQLSFRALFVEVPAPVRCRAAGQPDREMTVTNQARQGRPPGKARRTSAFLGIQSVRFDKRLQFQTASA
jgi:hypothetical protein